MCKRYLRLHIFSFIMAVNIQQFETLSLALKNKNVTLVAVSKFKDESAILELYNRGQRHFGENYVQELEEKYNSLPKDINWHFIGHLQSNKAKAIVPFVYLIHGVDSLKLLKEINKQAQKAGRVQPVLLQVHIAGEDTKFGLSEQELDEIITALPESGLPNILVAGLMGMATFTDDKDQVAGEFALLKQLFDKYAPISTPTLQLQFLSMGMSDDYELAIEQGSNMVRIGSLLFGRRS